MIGSRFLELAGNEFNSEKNLLLSSAELNLITANQAEIEAKFSDFKNHQLLHFAAFTDVDGAETQRGDENGSCWQLNVEATKKLAKVCQKLNLKIVYISTDFVFDGKNGPYSEEDTVAKSESDISWYGWTKLTGERTVLETMGNFLIVRTSYPYRANFPNKLDFVRNIIERLRSGNLYPMFSDQFLTPTFSDNFSKALNFLLKQNQTGIWHVVDNTTLSAYQAEIEIAKVFGFDYREIKKASVLEFQRENPQAAKRPVKGGLKNDKLRRFGQKFGVSMQDFSQALVEMKKQMGVSS